jgi:hypothetical protein
MALSAPSRTITTPKRSRFATALGSEQKDMIRRRIANRIARRASAAVRSGDRGEAQALLDRADNYPPTALTRQARSNYRAALARAVKLSRLRLAPKKRR